MKHVLLTGAAGRLGTVLSVGLPAPDLKLELTDRVSIPVVESGASYTTCDLRELDQLIALANGADTIVHVAGIPDEAPFAALNASNIVWGSRVCPERKEGPM